MREFIMSSKNILYLGSDSASRKMLLTQSKIPFKVVGHLADESQVDANLSLEEQVGYIAQLKMDHINLGIGSYEGEIRYVLTADTMGCDAEEKVHGKPTSREDAYNKIRKLSGTYRTATGFCIQKRVWHNNEWVIEQSHSQVVSTIYTFRVSEKRIEDYFENTPGLTCSGAIAVEDYGLQFLESLQGSYSSVVGLPLYEVRTILENYGFFD